MSRIVLIALMIVISTSFAFAQEATPEPTPEGPIRLVVWLPDTLSIADVIEEESILEAQTQAFVESLEEPVEIEFRLKRVGTVGGIMSTLRSASSVAPGALPDITLLRRQDLVVAQRSGLIRSMEGLVSSAVVGGLDTALVLGQVDGELVGVPYLLNLQHVVYRPDANTDYDTWTFDAMLERGESFIFPAGRATGINDVLLLQYLVAGGTMPRDGTFEFNAEGLQVTLEFYENALRAGLLDAQVLNYVSAADYTELFQMGQVDVGVFPSNMYLMMHAEDETLQAAPIFTETGEPVTLLDGWSWVLVTGDPDRQDVAAQYINWMLDIDRQGVYAQSVSMLPSQRSAFSRWLPDGVDVRLFTSLLDNATLPFIDSDGITAISIAQDALGAVLREEQTAAEATEAISAQLNVE